MTTLTASPAMLRDAAAPPSPAPHAPPSAHHPDQAARLRELIDRLRDGPAARHEPRPADTLARATHTTPVAAITSGKGGVGKTVLAVNLAIALARLGLRVVLVDADLGTANADVLCGLSPRRRLDDVVKPAPHAPNHAAHRHALASIAMPAPGGFWLVPGPVGLARLGENEDARRAVLAALAELESRADLILVDTGAGVGASVTTVVRAADLALVVATPEPTSIADAYALMKCCAADPRPAAPPAPHAIRAAVPEAASRLALVVNQARAHDEAARVHARIAAVTDRFLRFRPDMPGWLPLDPAVRASVRARRPYMVEHHASPAGRHTDQLALTLARRLGVLRHTPGAARRTSVLARLLALASRHRAAAAQEPS